jgi:ornithine cyclodeaminase/alanine dehydrogenase-like protein (mu-crystallin family)
MSDGPAAANRLAFVDKAGKGAAIITLATQARVPVRTSSMLEPGTHINVPHPKKAQPDLRAATPVRTA